jgi:hypothetical protein
MPDNPFTCVSYMTAVVNHNPVEKTREVFTARFVCEDEAKESTGYLRGTVQHHRGVQPCTDLAARRVHPAMREKKVQNDPCAGTGDREGHCPSDRTKPRAGDDLLSFRSESSRFRDCRERDSCLCPYGECPCLHSPPVKIEADLRSGVSILRRIQGGLISRELWTYSRYGVLRFFHVEETGLVELKSDGMMMVTSPKETATAGVPTGNDVPGTAGPPAPTVTGVAE